MWDDPIVAETRQACDQIAARFDYEIQAIGEYFKTKRASEARALIAKVVAQAQASSSHSSNVTSSFNNRSNDTPNTCDTL